MEFDDALDFRLIGRKVRDYRKMRGMTQEKLAEAAAVSVPYVSHIERGTKRASISALIKLSAALGISVDDAFFTILREYKEWQDNQRILLGDAWVGTTEDPRVFTSENGTPIFPTTPTWWLSKFTKEIGLKHLSIHSLRHTFASLMIADDVSIVEVSNQMGHARTSTTTNIYGHVIDAAHAKGLHTLDKFNDLLIPSESSN